MVFGIGEREEKSGEIALLPSFMRSSRAVQGDWMNFDVAIGVAVGAGMTMLSGFIYNLARALQRRIVARRKALRDASAGVAAKSTVLVVVEGGDDESSASLATIYRDFYIEALDINVKMYFTGLAVAPKLTLSCFDSDQWRTVADAATGTASQITHTPTPLKKQLFLKNARRRPAERSAAQVAAATALPGVGKKKVQQQHAVKGKPNQSKRSTKSWQTSFGKGKSKKSSSSDISLSPERAAHIGRTVRAARQQFEPVRLEATFVESAKPTPQGSQSKSRSMTALTSAQQRAATSLATLKRVSELPLSKGSKQRSLSTATAAVEKTHKTPRGAMQPQAQAQRHQHQRQHEPTQKHDSRWGQQSMQSPFERDADLMPLTQLYAMTVRPNVYEEAERPARGRASRSHSWSPGKVMVAGRHSNSSVQKIERYSSFAPAE
jgi:hypothetical protein